MSGTNYTQFSYECSRQNATITYGDDFSEWENVFSEGIELKKGDQVRLLGSFVHQGSDATEIEVEQDMELNISYSPFLLAETIDTLDSTADGQLQNLSDLTDLAYGTDSFGIEPPVRNTTENNPDQFLCDPTGPQGRGFPKADEVVPAAGGQQAYTEKAYSNPETTGIQGGDQYGFDFNYWSVNTGVVPGDNARNTMTGDSSAVFGTNIKTDKLYTDQNKARLDYSNFAKSRANCEMYVGNMVKKLILPVFDRFFNHNTTANPKGIDGQAVNNRLLDDLVLDPPVAGIGMLNGCPKVGMCIATVNIAQSSGWYDAEGNAYFENSWDADNAPGTTYVDGSPVSGGGPFTYAGTSGYTGVPNLSSGVESVIGTIIATRPILHNINGKSTPCWEIMVSEFVNPASISNKPILKTFNANRLTKAHTFTAGDAGNTINCFRPLHGSGTTERNANFNPSINNINGAFNQMTQGHNNAGSAVDGLKAGMMSNTPTRNSYLLNDPANGPNYRTQFEQGGNNPNASYFEMGLGQPQGLSFLWNGSHTGYLRYNKTRSNVDRYRANHFMFWNRNSGDTNELVANTKIHDIRLTARGSGDATSFENTAELMEMGSVPVCFGAYIICKKETMMDIVKGRYTNITDYWTPSATNQPRIWFDFAYQQTQSDYKVRHYVGNSYDTSTITINHLNNPDLNLNDLFPRGDGQGNGVPPFVNEKRYNYNMCGRPLNINYRKSSGETGNADIAQGIDLDDVSRIAGNSGTGQDVALAVGDFMPRYFNTPDGLNPLNGIVNIPFQMAGQPSVWGGYNTCCNSIYFQQKETGDPLLGNTSLRALGVVNANTNIGADPRLVVITKATLLREGTAQPYTPTPGNFIRIVGIDNVQFHNVSEIQTVVDGGATWNITIQQTSRFYVDFPAGTQVIISRGASYMPKATGTDGNPWASDHIMIKEQLIKLKVEAGFYTEEQLAERINDQLHYNSEEFKRRYGTKNVDGTFSLPTTMGNKEKALTSQPSIVNGNFLATYIPDINFAFSPVTVDNAETLDLTASTKDITSELFTYDPVIVNGEFQYYHPELITTQLPYNGTTVRRLYDHSNNFETVLGKHFKIYTIPQYDRETPSAFKELTLARLRGGSLNTQLDFISDDPGATPPAPSYWHNDHTRFAGTYEMLRAIEFDGEFGYPQNYLWSTESLFSYRTRLTRNIFASGGSSRVFIGANNFTFSWEDGANRYSFNNLYTPLRPHKPETNGTDAKEDFGIGDAIPSAVINSKPTGTIISQLCGIYINNLNGDLFTQENWGVATIGNSYLYDTITSSERLLKNTTFLNILGFTLNQLEDFGNTFTPGQDIFLYRDETTQSGTAIRVGAKITTAVNGSNPTASKCLAIAPVQQFMVQVDTDDFYGQNAPLKGNDPYFFIGSTFPFKEFYGNDNGSKLPIMGICARNFQAFGFSFDLGGSAVSYLIERDMTITNIRTKIYTSNLQTPTNLSPYSSVIYLITRYNYIQDVPPQIGVDFAKQEEEEIKEGMVDAFTSPPTATIRTYPPVQPSQYYYTGYGQQLPPLVEDDESD